MIEIPRVDETERAVWETLIDLHRQTPEGWTLIGAQMVALHGYEHGRRRPRRSRDADVLVDVRVVQDGTRRFGVRDVDCGWGRVGSDDDMSRLSAARHEAPRPRRYWALALPL